MPPSHRRGSYFPLPASISCLLSFAAAASPVFAEDIEHQKPFAYHETNILGTSLDLQVGAPSQADADAIHTALLAEIERLRGLLSTYDPASDLSKVNASTAPVTVAPEVIAVLQLYDRWATTTDGAFSGRTGDLTALWKDAEKNGTLPDKAKVAALAASLRDPLWKMDAAKSTVQHLSDHAINVDSLGKGFIISRAAATIKAKFPRLRGMLLNIGGDITLLNSPSQFVDDKWTVPVADPAHPQDNATPLTTLVLTNLSVATSGSYERGFEVGTRKFSHILDPRTGYPVDFDASTNTPRVAAATVIGPSNAAANALATSLCVLTPDQGLALLQKTPGAEALLVLSDGSQRRSKGFKQYEVPKPVPLAPGWANGARVSIGLQLKAPPRSQRPYMAAWVEDATGRHVVTLAQWGNNERFTSNLSTWWRVTADVPNILQAVSRATRPFGKYTLEWNGRDQTGVVVAPGKYKIFVEVTIEHGGHSLSSAVIDCGGDKTETSMPPSQYFDPVAVSFLPKGP